MPARSSRPGWEHDRSLAESSPHGWCCATSPSRTGRPFTATDPIPRWFGTCPGGPNTLSDTQAFLKRKLDSQRADPRRVFDLAVTLASGGDLIGAAGVRITSPQFRTASMGYAYRRDVWGQGYATEAARALVAFGFQELGMHRIYAFCDTDNAASARVLEKTGLQREGRLRQPRAGAWPVEGLIPLRDLGRRLAGRSGGGERRGGPLRIWRASVGMPAKSTGVGLR